MGRIHCGLREWALQGPIISLEQVNRTGLCGTVLWTQSSHLGETGQVLLATRPVHLAAGPSRQPLLD